jgi:hypothetical protein
VNGVNPASSSAVEAGGSVVTIAPHGGVFQGGLSSGAAEVEVVSPPAENTTIDLQEELQDNSLNFPSPIHPSYYQQARRQQHWAPRLRLLFAARGSGGTGAVSFGRMAPPAMPATVEALLAQLAVIHDPARVHHSLQQDDSVVLMSSLVASPGLATSVTPACAGSTAGVVASGVSAAFSTLSGSTQQRLLASLLGGANPLVNNNGGSRSASLRLAAAPPPGAVGNLKQQQQHQRSAMQIEALLAIFGSICATVCQSGLA